MLLRWMQMFSRRKARSAMRRKKGPVIDGSVRIVSRTREKEADRSSLRTAQEEAGAQAGSGLPGSTASPETLDWTQYDCFRDSSPNEAGGLSVKTAVGARPGLDGLPGSK